MADFKTRQELIYRALKNIGIIEAGEAPSSEDYATVDDLLDPLVAQLAADDIFYVHDTDEIQPEVYLPLSRILGNICGPDFGSPINEEAKLSDELVLRRLNASRPTFEAMKVDYF
ncbi:MAG: hypothetical protein NT113_07050 [Hyphomicrobiales bacterium]|nr:hypothetical protein [Hyphomicrobiales bacterium]